MLLILFVLLLFGGNRVRFRTEDVRSFRGSETCFKMENGGKNFWLGESFSSAETRTWYTPVMYTRRIHADVPYSDTRKPWRPHTRTNTAAAAAHLETFVDVPATTADG